MTIFWSGGGFKLGLKGVLYYSTPLFGVKIPPKKGGSFFVKNTPPGPDLDPHPYVPSVQPRPQLCGGCGLAGTHNRKVIQFKNYNEKTE